MKFGEYKDIVFAGSAGLSGAMKLAAANPDEIRKRFPGHILTEYFSDAADAKSAQRRLADFSDSIPSHLRESVCFLFPAGECGIMQALWDLGEMLRSGFEVNADSIPVSQLTVEICELFGRDPFKIESEGCLLACTPHGNELCTLFRASGIRAEVIGHTTEKKGKVMIMGEVRRYIDKPR